MGGLTEPFVAAMFQKETQQSDASSTDQHTPQETDEPHVPLLAQEEDSTLLDLFGEKAKIYLTQHLVSRYLFYRLDTLHCN